MKAIKLGLAILVFMLVALPSMALAQEAPRYSFATAQGNSSLQAIPGKEAEQGVIYFYNVDGNRITHVTLEVLEAPSGWEVDITPALHQQEYSVSGTTITVTENLYVEPSQVSAEEITDVPEGMICLTLPNKLGEGVPGYCLAKVATITIHVPKSEKVGTTGDIKIRGTGSWLGQTGSASIQQQRDFDFNVTTVYDITNPEVPLTGKGFDVGRWVPVIVAVAIVAAAAVLLPRFLGRRKAG
jgi:hypothetical protein